MKILGTLIVAAFATFAMANEKEKTIFIQGYAIQSCQHWQYNPQLGAHVCNYPDMRVTVADARDTQRAVQDLENKISQLEDRIKKLESRLGCEE